MNIWMNLPDYLGNEEGGVKRFCKDSLDTGLCFFKGEGVKQITKRLNPTIGSICFILKHLLSFFSL
jgi:hypothetical protein